MGVINWSYQNKQPAGRFTDTLPESEAAWFPLQTATSQMGVFGVRLSEKALMDFTTRQSIELLHCNWPWSWRRSTSFSPCGMPS